MPAAAMTRPDRMRFAGVMLCGPLRSGAPTGKACGQTGRRYRGGCETTTKVNLMADYEADVPEDWREQMLLGLLFQQSTQTGLILAALRTVPQLETVVPLLVSQMEDGLSKIDMAPVVRAHFERNIEMIRGYCGL